MHASPTWPGAEFCRRQLGSAPCRWHPVRVWSHVKFPCLDCTLTLHFTFLTFPSLHFTFCTSPFALHLLHFTFCSSPFAVLLSANTLTLHFTFLILHLSFALHLSHFPFLGLHLLYFTFLHFTFCSSPFPFALHLLHFTFLAVHPFRRSP